MVAASELYRVAPLKSVGRRPLTSIGLAVVALVLATFCEGIADRKVLGSYGEMTVSGDFPSLQPMLVWVEPVSSDPEVVQAVAVAIRALGFGFLKLFVYLMAIAYLVQYVEGNEQA